MATVTKAETLVGEERFLLPNVGWEIYEMLLERYADRGPRMYYLRGDIELMSPLIPHELYGNLLRFMVETVAEEMEILFNPLGSTTFRHKLAERGVEADKCYLIANAGKIPKHRRSPDLDIDPPPDLAIEIEITKSILDKLDIYAGIGVPEIWRFDGEILTVLLRQADGNYLESPTSKAFPFLPMGDLVRFIEEYEPGEELRWRRSFRAWCRDVLLPLYRAPDGPAL